MNCLYCQKYMIEKPSFHAYQCRHCPGTPLLILSMKDDEPFCCMFHFTRTPQGIECSRQLSNDYEHYQLSATYRIEYYFDSQDLFIIEHKQTVQDKTLAVFQMPSPSPAEVLSTLSRFIKLQVFL